MFLCCRLNGDRGLIFFRLDMPWRPPPGHRPGGSRSDPSLTPGPRQTGHRPAGHRQGQGHFQVLGQSVGLQGLSNTVRTSPCALINTVTRCAHRNNSIRMAVHICITNVAFESKYTPGAVGSVECINCVVLWGCPAQPCTTAATAGEVVCCVFIH